MDSSSSYFKKNNRIRSVYSFILVDLRDEQQLRADRHWILQVHLTFFMGLKITVRITKN